MQVITSWDDGHPSDLHVADLLLKYGLRGTFFVPSINREGKAVLNINSLRDIDRLFEIGGHTLTHKYLIGLDYDVIYDEVFKGKSDIEDKLGHSIIGFSYPGGKYNESIIEIVKSAGYKYSRTTEIARDEVGNNLWKIPTTMQVYPHKPLVFFKNLIRYPGIKKIPIVLSRFREKNYWKFAEKTIADSIQTDKTFHLWGHSWEIDDNNLWSKLEDLLKILSSVATKKYSIAESINAKNSQ